MNPQPRADWRSELFRLLRSRAALGIAGVVLLAIGLRVATNLFFRDHVVVRPVMVKLTNPEPHALDPTISLPGNMEAIEQASVYAHVSGYLRKMTVDEGDQVKTGEILAEIEAPDVVNEFNKVKADLGFRKVTKERYDQLLKESVISQQEYDSINSSYDEALARYEAAAANMDYTKVRAPFSGSIARRYKYSGDLISASSNGGQTPIFLLINESKLRVAINVPQSDTSNIRSGNLVDIKVDTYTDQVFHGTVSRLDDLLDSATKTQRILIDIDNPDHKLHAGMFATVVLHFDHPKTGGIVTIPASALKHEDDKYYVFKFMDGVARRVNVTTGFIRDDLAEVTQGLEPQDKVIIPGAATFKDGDTVVVEGAPQTNRSPSNLVSKPFEE